MDDSIIFEIEDHGPGIPTASKVFIFDRFYRVDPSKPDKNHVGLGLSIKHNEFPIIMIVRLRKI